MAVAGLRRRHVEEEGESVFVSMTDLTVSFLFILLVLLAFFATQIQPEEMVPLGEYERVQLELSEARAVAIRLQEALASERDRIGRLEQERRDLVARLAEAADAKRQVEEVLANERRRIDRLEGEKRVLVDRLADANRTIAELRARIEALRAQLAATDTKIAAFPPPRRSLTCSATSNRCARSATTLASVSNSSNSRLSSSRSRSRIAGVSGTGSGCNLPRCGIQTRWLPISRMRLRRGRHYLSAWLNGFGVDFRAFR